MGFMSLLLVDDNSLFLRIATRFLEGFPELELLGSAATADEAQEKVVALQPDIVLMDLNLPGLTGLKLIPRLRELRPAVKVIVLTLWDSDIYRQAALAAGADEFVSKAQINATLVPAIRRLYPTSVA
jgi:two-component system response regulator NreC